MFILFPKVPKDVKFESTENRRFPKSHCRLTPSLQGYAANIRINIIFPLQGPRVIALYFFADGMGLSSFEFCAGFQKQMFFK